MYASPTVLIFSSPARAGELVEPVKTSSSSVTYAADAMRSACAVNPTMSANRTLTSSRPSAMNSVWGGGCLALLQAVDDRARQGVQEQVVRAAPLEIELVLTQEQQSGEPLEPVGRRHADRREGDDEVVGEDDVNESLVNPMTRTS